MQNTAEHAKCFNSPFWSFWWNTSDMQQTLCLDLLQSLLDMSEALREVTSYVKEKYGLLPMLKCQVTKNINLAASEECTICSFPHRVFSLFKKVSFARYSWSVVYSSIVVFLTLPTSQSQDAVRCWGMNWGINVFLTSHLRTRSTASITFAFFCFICCLLGRPRPTKETYRIICRHWDLDSITDQRIFWFNPSHHTWI